jgi:sugar phosphate isomerase/epimerase
VGVIWEIDVACKDGEVPSEGYPHVRGLIREVHVKPNPNHFTDPADGDMDVYERAFRLLAEDGYDGLATIEHWKSKEGTLEGIHWLKELLSML